MLVLSRREQETLEITQNGKHIATVAVLRIKGSKCRLGIKADADVKIMRTELETDDEPKAA